MKPSAIIYTSKTGHTRQYALLLGKEIGLPVYSYDDSVSKLPGGSNVIYLGWIHASHMDKLMISMLTKGLSAQKQRSAQDERMLELLSKDASYVSMENLAGILQWYKEKM